MADLRRPLSELRGLRDSLEAQKVELGVVSRVPGVDTVFIRNIGRRACLQSREEILSGNRRRMSLWPGCSPRPRGSFMRVRLGYPSGARRIPIGRGLRTATLPGCARTWRTLALGAS